MCAFKTWVIKNNDSNDQNNFYNDGNPNNNTIGIIMVILIITMVRMIITIVGLVLVVITTQESIIRICWSQWWNWKYFLICCSSSEHKPGEEIEVVVGSDEVSDGLIGLGCFNCHQFSHHILSHFLSIIQITFFVITSP